MKINLKVTGIEVSEDFKEKIEQKINSLEKFAKDTFGEKYWNGFFGKGKPRAEAFVEVAKTTRHHKKGPFFYVECNLMMLGELLRAEAERENLEVALNEVKEELERQILKFKERPIAKYERGARKLKKKLLLSKGARKKEGKRELIEGI